MKASKNRARLSVERLEAREVMDAAISVAGGALNIDGTRLADAFRVTEVEVDGARGYQVNALVHEGRQTTFNDGQTSGVFRANRITADLLQGDDLLILENLSTRSTQTPLLVGGGIFGRPRTILRTTPGDVTINTNGGADAVHLLNASINGRMIIDLGAGQDLATVAASSVSRSVEVRGKAGVDHWADFGGNNYGTEGPTLSSIIATHRESVNGQVTSRIDPTADNPLGTMTGVGTGDATYLGHYSETFIHNFTAPNAQGVGQVLSGRFSSTAADGSTISGTYSGTYTLLADGMIRFDVTPIWEEGTGRFAGVTGSGYVVALMNGATGAFHFDTVASLTFP